MEGIEVLNEFVVDISALGYIAIIPGAIFFIFCLICGVMACLDSCPGPGIALFALSIVCVFLFGLGVGIVKTPPETHYQVIIDESVPMTQFYEKYEIIEQNGKIYTIREKVDK